LSGRRVAAAPTARGCQQQTVSSSLSSSPPPLPTFHRRQRVIDSFNDRHDRVRRSPNKVVEGGGRRTVRHCCSASLAARLRSGSATTTPRRVSCPHRSQGEVNLKNKNYERKIKRKTNETDEEKKIRTPNSVDRLGGWVTSPGRRRLRRRECTGATGVLRMRVQIDLSRGRSERSIRQLRLIGN
jgi:hypothetical protein